MIQGQVFSPPSQTRWRGVVSSNRLDCETAVLLRRALWPVFQSATSWPNLRRQLRAKGFDLSFFKGRLILTDAQTGERICSCKFLGHPLAVLTARLGRVRAKAPRGRNQFGQLLA